MADKTVDPPSSLPAPLTHLPVKAELESPNELFKKMVVNNKKQNQRLSANYDQKGTKSSLSVNFIRDGAKNSPNECKPLNIGLRFIICSLGIAALTMCQMSRMILNLTITSMVDPLVLNQGSDISSDGSCPWPVEDGFERNEELETSESKETAPIDGILFYLTTEQSNLESNDSLVLVESDRFMWSMQEQSILLGGFFYSYFFFMVLGGRMAEIYGSKYIILLAVAGSASINLSTPWLANYSYTLFVLSRVLMGIIQAGVVPGIYALFSQWLTVTETGIFTSLIKVMFCAGSILGSLVFGLFMNWQNVFYITGLMGSIWSVLWIVIATSRPQDNKWLSENELKHITKKKRKTPQKQNEDLELDVKGVVSSEFEKLEKARSKVTPWIEILTNPSVIGFVLVKLSYNYLLDFITIELPSYLKYVHHASNQTISLISTVTTLLQVLFVAFVAWLAQILIRRRTFNLSKTVWRKIFQGLGSYGVGLGLIVLSLNNCSLLFVSVVLLCISFFCMFTVGGEAVLPYDLSDEYPATIMAIANSVANVSGITTTLLAGWILGDQGGSYERWNILIRLVGGINILGGLAFSLLVKAKPIVFKESVVAADAPHEVKIESQLEKGSEKEKADSSTNA